MHLVAVSVFALFITLSFTSTVVAPLCHNSMQQPDKAVRSMGVKTPHARLLVSGYASC